jgi:hypothetical protein
LTVKRRHGRRAPGRVARRLPQPARDAAAVEAAVDEQVEHVAALADGDEAGQFALHRSATW